MATTTNYSWDTPDDTDLVKDGAAAIRTLGSSIDTTTKNLNPQTTTGAIAYRSATSNVNTSLPIGTAGQVLTVNSGATAPQWATPASGGGMTVIASGTLSGASVTISSISGAYKDLRLVVKNWKPATDNETLKAQLNGDTGSSYYAGVAMSTNPNNVTFNDTFIYICSFQDNATAQGFSQSTFYEYANTTTWKAYEGITVNNNATTVTNANALYQNGFFNSTAAITEIKLFPNAGNHTSGDYILYGIN